MNAAMGGGQLGANQAQSIGGLMGGVGAANATGKLAGMNSLMSGISGLGNSISSGLGYMAGQQPPAAVWG